MRTLASIFCTTGALGGLLAAGLASPARADWTNGFVASTCQPELNLFHVAIFRAANVDYGPGTDVPGLVAVEFTEPGEEVAACEINSRRFSIEITAIRPPSERGMCRGTGDASGVLKVDGEIVQDFGEFFGICTPIQSRTINVGPSIAWVCAQTEDTNQCTRFYYMSALRNEPLSAEAMREDIADWNRRFNEQ